MKKEELNGKELNEESLKSVSGGQYMSNFSNSGDTPKFKVGDIVYYEGSRKWKAEVIEVSSEKKWVPSSLLDFAFQWKYLLRYLNTNNNSTWEYEYLVESVAHKD